MTLGLSHVPLSPLHLQRGSGTAAPCSERGWWRGLTAPGHAGLGLGGGRTAAQARAAAVEPQHLSLSPVRNTRVPAQALAAQSLREIRAAGEVQTHCGREELCDPLGAAGKGDGDGVRNMLRVSTEPLGS